MDTVTYALCKKIAASALSGVASMTVEGTTLKITTKEGNDLNMVFQQPKDGVSIVNVDVTSEGKIKCTMSDGTTKITNAILVETDDIPYTNPDEEGVTNLKEALDKLFEDGSGILEEEIRPTVKQGSVKQVYPVGTSFTEILKDMLVEKVAPVVTMSINPSAVLYDEVSDSISSLTINATVTKKTNSIAKVVFYINDTIVSTVTANVANGGTFPYIYNKTIDDDTTLKVVVIDSEGLSSNVTKTINFVGNSYYGLIDAGTSEPTEALIKTLNKNLKNSKKYIYEGITTDWAKICYAYPAELGKLTSIMDKVNNFNYTSSFQLTTVKVDNINYYVYTLIDPTGADGVTLTFE